MEYQKTDAEKALTFFQLLLDQHADYVPTYYHVGKLYVEKDEVTKAKDTFEKGIEVCRKCSDLKAMRELQNALNELELD
jgi:tetratricopeptide (TPR) repeat protein